MAPPSVSLSLSLSHSLGRKLCLKNGNGVYKRVPGYRSLVEVNKGLPSTQLVIMQAAAEESFHGNFLKTMLMGIKLGVSSEKMSCQERKRAIKLSANIAMAAASRDMKWSRALIAHHAKHSRNRALVRRLVGRKRYESVTKPANFPARRMVMMIRRRARGNPSIRRGANAPSATARVVAKSTVRKRTGILKRLVPGGESMDDFSLLGETIDYVISLQAQVNLMRLLTEAVGVSDLRPPSKGETLP